MTSELRTEKPYHVTRADLVGQTLLVAICAYAVGIRLGDLWARYYRPTAAQVSRVSKGSTMRITTIYGPMFGGKTQRLVDRILAQSGKFVVAKHSKDMMRLKEPALSSHDGDYNLKVPATPINSVYQILEYLEADTKTVFIDEAQWFDLSHVVMMLQKLKDRDIHFVFAGLDMNFKAEPWPTMAYLIEKADEKVHCTAACVVCGGIATLSYYKDHASRLDVPGGADLYEPRCGDCHKAGMLGS